MKKKFLLCKTCGNILEIVNDGGVVPVCCGASMEELIPNTVEAAQEKHIPEVAISDRSVVVKVGSVIHPMEDEHYIKMIEIVTNKRDVKVNPRPGMEPIMELELLASEEVEEVYAYCNLHGLWIKKIS